MRRRSRTTSCRKRQISSRLFGALPSTDPGGPPKLAIGCFMTFAGFFSMAMVGVLVARIYSWVNRCPYQEGMPACNWWVFAGVGGLIGAITLPVLVLRRLKRG